MSLEDWLNDNFIEKCSPSPKTIATLLKLCDRDLLQSSLCVIGIGLPRKEK